MERTREEWIEEKRLRKVRLIAPVLRKRQVTPSQAAEFSDFDWAEVAAEATDRCGSTVGPPSERSRRLIIAHLSSESPAREEVRPTSRSAFA